MEVDKLIVSDEARINTLKVISGEHGAASFDELTGRRKAESVIHDVLFHYDQKPGIDVASESRIIGVVREDAVITEIAITPDVKPSHPSGGTDKTYNVDVLRCPSGGVYVSLFSSPVEIDSTDVNKTPIFTVPVTTILERGDQLKVTVVASGTTNTQGQGLSVDVFMRQHGAA